MCSNSATTHKAKQILFSKIFTQGKHTILSVYVDNKVITGDDLEEIKILKQTLSSEFEVKDLESLQYFLGIEVAQSDKGTSVSQHKYTLDLLKETGMLDCKPADTLTDPNVKLVARTTEVVTNKERFQ